MRVGWQEGWLSCGAEFRLYLIRRSRPSVFPIFSRSVWCCHFATLSH